MSEPQKKTTRPPKKNLNVSIEDGAQWTRVADHRGLSIEELFAEKDVREFVTHLLVEEHRKEGERLKVKQKR